MHNAEEQKQHSSTEQQRKTYIKMLNTRIKYKTKIVPKVHSNGMQNK